VFFFFLTFQKSFIEILKLMILLEILVDQNS